MLVSLLSILAVGVVTGVRRQAKLAQRSFDSLQLQETADSALRLKLLELAMPLAADTESAIGSQTRDIFGIDAHLDVTRESGRVDLNYAGPELIAAVFAANGTSSADASSYADRIIDWRDPDDQRGEQGAERPDYEQAGRYGTPRNGPFESVAELCRVLGLEKSTDEMLDAFTVYSHISSVRSDAATPAVARALQLLETDSPRDRPSNYPRNVTSHASQQQRDFSGDLLRLQACVEKDTQKLCRIVVARITGDVQRPFQTFRWDSLRTETSRERSSPSR
jgi:hypothetical protein